MFKQKKLVKSTLLAVIVMMAMLFASCGANREDEEPPTAPLLTISSVDKEAIDLAWSESYDDEGVDNYKVYRDGDELAEIDDTEYTDKDISTGKEYEYYVVAYDEAGNRSSKSVKQRVKVPDGEEPTQTPSPDEPGEPGQNNANGNINIQKLSRSTIKLYTLDNDYNVVAMGSGTIVSKEGFILTNFHCVGTDQGELYNSDGYVAIAITDDIKKNIQPQYIAQYRSGVQELDLAVIKIVSDLNWNEVSGADLNLVPIKITDSDSVELGDDINILGYPGVGGETITFTAGRVSGFLDDNDDSVVDWIKTDAVVNHGNSGGTAINSKGEMIGVPTAKQVGEDNDIMFYLKPVNQAISVLEDALAQGDDPSLPEPGDPGNNEDPGETITVYGRIVDSYTQEPIAGASFAVLQDGITLEAFSSDPQDSMILAYGESDSDGAITLYNIPKGTAYSVIVGADGYEPILEDQALEIPSDWDGDMDIGDVYLEAE